MAGFSLTAFCLVGWLLGAGAQDANEEYRLITDASSIRLGDSAGAIAGKLQPAWVPVSSNMFLPKYPFNRLLPYTNGALVSEWRSEKPFVGWPLVLFAVFNSPAKTNMVDALLFTGGLTVKPMVDGLYNRRLLALKKGDSVRTIYGLLGRRSADYYMGPSGKWFVELEYWANDGGIIRIQADAATGIVTDVDNVGRL